MPVTMRVSSSLSLGSDGRGDGERELEQFDLAGGDGVEFEPVEARGLLGVVDGGGDGLFVEFGGDGLGIVGDVGGLDPVGAARRRRRGGGVSVRRRR